MPTPTYTPLANITLTGSAASVTFSSISQAYRDLILIYDGTGSSSNYVQFQVNSDTGSNYSYTRMGGYTGGILVSTSSPINYIRPTYSDASQKVSGQIHFMDYSATDKHKTFLSKANGFDVDPSIQAIAGRWANTAAITAINIYRDAGNFAAGSTFALFGVAA